MKIMSPIIPVSEPDCQQQRWKNLLKSAVSDPQTLLNQLGLSPSQLPFEIGEATPFVMRVPQPFIDKMNYADPNDPLLLQVLSQNAENQPIEGYTSDPLKELDGETPGLLHKYHGRVLLILASACAVNCRYCFRRHFPYQDKTASGEQLAQSIEYIRNSPSISEVILSGGDPLIVNDQTLKNLLFQLESIPHIKRLRIHTRLPVVIPQRITKKLCLLLASSRLQISMVLHINHPNEIDVLLADSIAPLKQAGVQLFNQSVLLKGINNQIETQTKLSEALFDVGIVPYYLHLLDKVAGAAHFDLEKAEAKALLTAMRARLPGYLVPRLAAEIAGESSKTVIA